MSTIQTKEISKQYRPIPFWSWNEKLDTAETERQAEMMDQAGIGGYFMHARGGLQTEYMGEEWFENVSAATEEANRREMRAWAYDENGWPSGFGNGIVNGLGVNYQQKYLRMSDTEPQENVICKSGEHWFYFDINPFYVDVLDRKVIAEFIKTAYEPYYEKFGNDFEGFFTDEPQISRNGIPWSFVLEEKYQEAYGEALSEQLEALFLPVGDFQNVRVKFWKLVTQLFSESFLKQVYDWCDKRGLKLTGHLVLEESFLAQLTTNGACMPHYEYFHIPGMDWLGRDIFDCFTPKQVSSVAEQLGKKQVLAETFALCGHNVSLAELKGIYEWQMVHGINLLCQHLEGYSIRGMRKRDYPPAMYYQQPWWKEYHKFNDAMSRIGMILSEGEKKAEVLLLHPTTTAWTLFDNGKNEGLGELNAAVLSCMKRLEEKHIAYHLGDEIIMERHAFVKDGKLVIGEQAYSVVIDSYCKTMLPNTKKLLEEFAKQGGRICSVNELRENSVIDHPQISYTKREYSDCTVHYFVNTSAERRRATVSVSGKMLDIYTGEQLPFTGEHEFEPWGSLLVIEDGSENIPKNEKAQHIMHLEGDFQLSEAAVNLLTLDCCDYYFDGKLQEKNGYVLNICERANALARKIQIHQDYRVFAEYIPEDLKLVCETPEMFEITVNGKKVEESAEDWVIDKSFRTIAISRYMKQGENVISFDCNFAQQDSVYECLEKAKVFESEKNKLVYDMEIEAIYLLGDFSVKTNGNWEALDKNAVRYAGDFVLAEPKRQVSLAHLEQQGFPFFCGRLTLEGEIDIADENSVLEFSMKGISAVAVEINGVRKTIITDNRMPLSEFGVRGKNKIKLTVTNNLRNLLGPHHLAEGESHQVGPDLFYREACVWHPSGQKDWNEGYCFCEMSV